MRNGNLKINDKFLQFLRFTCLQSLKFNIIRYLNMENTQNIKQLKGSVRVISGDFSSQKTPLFPHFWSGKTFKGIVANRALLSLHGGSLKNTIIHSLKNERIRWKKNREITWN